MLFCEKGHLCVAKQYIWLRMLFVDFLAMMVVACLMYCKAQAHEVELAAALVVTEHWQHIMQHMHSITDTEDTAI